MLKSQTRSALFLLASFAFTSACASADDTGGGDGPTTDGGADVHPTTDTGSTTTDTGSSTTDTGSTSTDTGTTHTEGGTCTSHCSSNAECDSTCPGVPTGSYNCCDVATGVCYVSAGFCPAPSDGGGVDTSPY